LSLRRWLPRHVAMLPRPVAGLRPFGLRFAAHASDSGALDSETAVDYSGAAGIFRPNPFSLRMASVTTPFFPIFSNNLRNNGGRNKKRQKRLRGIGGRRGRSLGNRAARHYSRAKGKVDGGQEPLFRRVPKWGAAISRNKQKKYEPLNLCRLRKYIERGQLDARFPITMRHLHESRCVSRVRVGVYLFNVNNYPFPYKIDIEVAVADQSSINAIKAVGGSVTIVHMPRLALRALVKPYKYDILPRHSRPNLETIHFMEKMRARGAKVRYIKPLWLLQEERKMVGELREFAAEEAIDDETSQTQ